MPELEVSEVPTLRLPMMRPRSTGIPPGSLEAWYQEVGRVSGRYWKRGAFRDQVILALQGRE